MKRVGFDADATARALLQVWRSGELLRELPPELRPETLEEGYEAQDSLQAAAQAARAGWKLGVGSPAQMCAGKLSRPLVGQLDGARLHGPGSHIALPSADPVTIECEIAFVLARDLPPVRGRALMDGDVLHSCVTFEVVRSRFADRRAVGWPSFAADNVGFEALVVGAAVCAGVNPNALRSLNDSAVVYVDGQPRASALSGESATDPLMSLGYLLAHASERGITLRAGDIVSTGAMCQPFDLVGLGHHVRVTHAYGELSFTCG